MHNCSPQARAALLLAQHHDSRSGNNLLPVMRDASAVLASCVSNAAYGLQHCTSSACCSPADTLNLSEPVLKAIRRKGYRLPTPIQRKTLPLILQVRAPGLGAGRAWR